MNKKDLAKQRIKKLLKKAQEQISKNPKRSHRYAEIAWKIKQKTETKLPKEAKLKICKKCQNYLAPNKTSRVRIHRSKVIITCKNCGNKRRIPLDQWPARYEGS
ncbi:ribonuclease P [archaeon SCG-AAA382B04]|nr:ribonuclease P [archaeon SCG-AAA382B04]